MTEHSFEFYGISFLVIILMRYFLLAGGIYLYLYLPSEKSWFDRNLTHWFSHWPSILHDIKLSVLSAGIFALASAFVMSAYEQGMTRLYSNVYPYDFWYLGASYLVILVFQDAFFYFTHRLFHHPQLFRWLHQGHHQSRYATPWTSFALDPLETVIQSSFLIAIVFLLPLHFITLIAVLTTMTFWSVLNHTGIDRFPLSFPHHWLGKWFIGPAHHSIHHHRYSKHYGLYFTFWDKFLNTQDCNYEKEIHGSPAQP
jgi:Delta7-sterol 5-desaturase